MNLSPAVLRVIHAPQAPDTRDVEQIEADRIVSDEIADLYLAQRAMADGALEIAIRISAIQNCCPHRRVWDRACEICGAQL